MKQYKTVNNLVGWITFLIAATVSYTHLDVYKRQPYDYQTTFALGNLYIQYVHIHLHLSNLIKNIPVQ